MTEREALTPVQGAPERIWLWFADNGNIRKWDSKPFPDGVEFARAEAAEALLTSPVQPAGTDVIQEALEPFARAWEIATNYKSVVHALTLGQLGSLAAHEVSANQFRNAYRALNPEKNNG